MAGRYAGRIDSWDAVNEPYRHRDILDLFGGDDAEEITHWLRRARAADPEAKLFVNDFRLLSDPSAEPVRVTYYLDLIDQLQANNAPLDGMGLQGHFSGELPAIPQILERLDAFAAKGLRLHVTEFDIATDDEQLQADFARDFLIACYSHPAVDAVSVWGFWEGQMFQPSGALFRRDWTPKPVGEVFQELIKQRWWTDTTATTDAAGLATVQGFVGDYDVTVQHQDQTVTRTLDGHGTDGTDITIRID
jgi:GH35 family endo-1,4-beta-xylanase